MREVGRVSSGKRVRQAGGSGRERSVHAAGLRQGRVSGPQKIRARVLQPASTYGDSVGASKIPNHAVAGADARVPNKRQEPPGDKVKGEDVV